MRRKVYKYLPPEAHQQDILSNSLQRLLAKERERRRLQLFSRSTCTVGSKGPLARDASGKRFRAALLPSPLLSLPFLPPLSRLTSVAVSRRETLNSLSFAFVFEKSAMKPDSNTFSTSEQRERERDRGRVKRKRVKGRPTAAPAHCFPASPSVRHLLHSSLPSSLPSSLFSLLPISGDRIVLHCSCRRCCAAHSIALLSSLHPHTRRQPFVAPRVAPLFPLPWP